MIKPRKIALCTAYNIDLSNIPERVDIPNVTYPGICPPENALVFSFGMRDSLDFMKERKATAQERGLFPEQINIKVDLLTNYEPFENTPEIREQLECLILPTASEVLWNEVMREIKKQIPISKVDEGTIHLRVNQNPIAFTDLRLPETLFNSKRFPNLKAVIVAVVLDEEHKIARRVCLLKDSSVVKEVDAALIEPDALVFAS